MGMGDSVPFCTNCGTSVSEPARFCPNCGTPQAGAARAQYSQPGTGGFVPHSPSADSDFLAGIGSRTASVLCYIPVFGVIPAIVFLASRRFRTSTRVRFDGFQSLYLFVAWLIVTSAAPTILFGNSAGFGVEHSLLSLLKLSVFICWLYLLVNAAQERQVRLPVIGDLAARSTNEQW